jgi:hypothetical protein
MATMSLHYTFSSRLLSLTTMIGAQVYRNGWKFLKLSKRRSLQSLCRHEAHCSISHFDNVSTTRFGSFVPPQLNASKKRWFSSCPQDHVHEDHAHIMEALKDAPGVQAGEGEKFVMVYTCTGGS